MKRRILKTVSVFMAVNMLAQICFPLTAYALTGGPSQPEVQSFEPVGTTEMVDLQSGDFVYNIPLLDVEGYPINISYHSGITMDQEASWVGLGWNINPGVINRNMRGIPDDFAGDVIKRDMYIKPNETYGARFGTTFEIFSFDAAAISVSAGTGVFYNNYRGVGFEQTIAPSVSAGNMMKMNATLSISSNSQSGMTISPSFGVSLSAQVQNVSAGASYSVGKTYNTRSGTEMLTVNKGASIGYGQFRMGASISQSSLSYATSTYVPQISMPMSGVNMTHASKMGGEIYGSFPNGSTTGYYAAQKIAYTSVAKRAIGYLYEDLLARADDILRDVNREKDEVFSKHSPTLPVTQFTHDLYAISGHGMDGMFRPHRGDLSHMRDDMNQSVALGGSLGGEVGFGNLMKWAIDANFNASRSKSGAWKASGGNMLTFPFSSLSKNNIVPKYEPSYFKMAGEKNAVVNTSFLAYKNMDEALRPAFSDAGQDIAANNLMKASGDESNVFAYSPITSDVALAKPSRERRNQSIQYLTIGESAMCLEKVRSYHRGSQYPFTIIDVPDEDSETDLVPRDREPAEEIVENKHITEIATVNPSGVRYVYGIAAYNHNKEDITFTNKDRSLTDQSCNGISDYNSSTYYTDKKGEDDEGYDGYYNATTLPPYAHSYLLSAVLSPDYVDVDQNGPDKGDLGTWTRINYSLVNNNYKWRTPYETKSVIHHEGIKCDKFDNKGTFIYGQKEMWHVHSIESQNYIAIFRLSSLRKDGKGVASVDGGAGSDSTYSLESISLYAKKDLEINELAAIPIKTVHFEYDYSLCQHVPNNPDTTTGSKGKLTLKKIWFTYGNSHKGKLSAYRFEYNSGTKNPDYHIRAYDRWGNYKPHVNCNAVGPTNAEFPYVIQDNATNDYAQAWCLKSIRLPSGGKIDVTYEADDYAYVQDKAAMQMFKVKGFSRDATDPAQSYLYNASEGYAYNFIHVEMPHAVTLDEFKKYVVPDPRYIWETKPFLFFTLLTNIRGADDPEYVRGYAEIDPVFTVPYAPSASGGGFTEFVMYAPPVPTEDDGGAFTTPFAKAAWQYFRLHIPHKVYPGSDMVKSGADVSTVVTSMFGIFFEMYDFIIGVNNRLLEEHYAEQVNTDKSWVRLKNPDGKKKGGGVRVKTLEISDSWNSMTASSAGSSYGQEYDYTIMDGNREISSGVATYEPSIGNEENPFHQPILYNKENALISDEKFYVEEPMGESYFPAPTITYSKVTVKSLTPEGIDLTRHSTGKTVHEFYTTRDFPTITKRTPVQVRKVEPDWISGFLSIETITEVTAIQGYQIELNDMNGKPKAQWVYETNIQEMAKDGKLVSGMQYFYKTEAPHHLGSNVRMIYPNGEIREDVLAGVECEMVMDSREVESTTTGAGCNFNTDMMLILFVPVPFPIPMFSYSRDFTRFRSAVTTRVIQRYGILERIVAHQEESTIATENYAFDSETGEPLLTATQNEFKDTIYNLTYPAHWVYGGMGQASLNWGEELDVPILTSGKIDLSTSFLDEHLFPGDEVITNEEFPVRRYVEYYPSSDEYRLIDYTGAALTPVSTTTYHLKILRSGRRNMQSFPVGTFTSKQLPVHLNISNGKKYVRRLSQEMEFIHTGVTEFSDNWKQYCENKVVGVTDIGLFNRLDVVTLLNYLFEASLVPGPALGPFGGPINITEESGHETSYLAYQKTFFNQVFEACSLTHAFDGNYNVVSDSMVYTFTLANCNLDPSLTEYEFKLKIPEDHPCTGYDTPVKVEYVSDITLGANNTARLFVKVYFTEGCFTDAVIEIPENASYGAYREKCVVAYLTNGNPYVTNEKGAWRRKKDYVQLVNRTPGNYTSGSNIRKDGAYAEFDRFWEYNDGAWEINPNPTKWTWTNEAKHYTPEGKEIENRDILNRHNAAVLDENNQVSYLGNNCERREMGFDGFEYYGAKAAFPSCPDRHWNFRTRPVGTTINYTVDDEVSHTGYQSIRLGDDNDVAISVYYVRNCIDNSATSYSVDENGITCEECIMPFAPYPGREYVISGWVKVVNSGDAANIEDRKANVMISFNNILNVGDTIYPSGTIIEGWQRFEKKFTIPEKAVSITVQLNRSQDDLDTWYDDVRIFPAKGNMKSFVYDPHTLRLMAELDENNYATFYEYDEQGALKRVKKETEKGVMTIKEARNHTAKLPD